MPSNIIQAIIQKAGSLDPVMRDSLIELARELERIGFIVDPAPIIPTKFSLLVESAPANVTIFEYVLNRTNISLSWEAPEPRFLFYEIRRGSSWNTASRILVTSSLSAVIEPLPIGTTTFLIKAMNVDGVYSIDDLPLDIVIPAIGNVSLTASTLDSNVLLYWTAPTSTFDILYYIVKKNGVELFRINSHFAHIKELSGGTYIYSVVPVDIVGNEGPEVSLELLVSDPPDFVLRDTFLSDFILGTKVNSVRQPENNSLLVCVNLTETYQDHFDTRSWASPQAQVDAGYPIYIQPVPTTASYKETFDMGVVVSGIIVSITWSYVVISQTFNIGVSTRTSDDNVIWTSPQLGQNVFFASGRYIEITVDFTGANDKALMEFFNFEVSVSVKEEMDSGNIAALAADATGTVVTFNKAFKAVNSITATPNDTNDKFALHNFAGGLNPTTFKVKVFNSAGVRQDATVDWKARGVV